MDFNYINKIEEEILKDVKKEWYPFIIEQRKQPYYHDLIENITRDYQDKIIYPDLYDILRVIKTITPLEIKVVIVGQDPYHNGMADGLAFSSKQAKIPASLKNIFKEIASDVGVENTNADLTNWQKQGVFLINSSLSVLKAQAKSHAKIGWQHFVLNLLKFIDSIDSYIFVLWGKDAQKFEKNLVNAIIIKGLHPSPLAGKGFFNQKYFSRINEILVKQNKTVIEWSTNDEI